MAKIRVLVVEDSLTVRQRLLDVLRADPEFEVVGSAENGQLGIELCRSLRPDVMTLDMHMPVLDGLAATEQIMGHHPTPILIVSSSTNRGDLFQTYAALAAGAVDVLEKPRGDETDDSWERRFVATVKLVSRIRVITHPRARLAGMSRAPVLGQPAPYLPSTPNPGERVVALGASTGGPGALVDVLRGMISDSDATVLVVLHIDEPFGAAFAEWLGAQTHRHVTYATDGELLSIGRGRVLMAPPGRHLVSRGGRLWLTMEAERHSCRPSIDVLFDSLASDCGPRVVAALLTGMGRDGASGLLSIRRAGGRTYAQDEASSIVYGMPREAALLGAAERVLPLSEIGAAISPHIVRVKS